MGNTINGYESWRRQARWEAYNNPTTKPWLQLSQQLVTDRRKYQSFLDGVLKQKLDEE